MKAQGSFLKYISGFEIKSMYVKREDCWECNESDVKRCEPIRYSSAVFSLFMDQSSASNFNYVLNVQGHECFSNHRDDGDRGCHSASRFV